MGSLTKLEKCISRFERYLSCTWNDKYGEGTVDFQFTEDLNSFAGYWSTSEYPNQKYPWDGYKNRVNQNSQCLLFSKLLEFKAVQKLNLTSLKGY